jgi:hypothetical protein
MSSLFIIKSCIRMSSNQSTFPDTIFGPDRPYHEENLFLIRQCAHLDRFSICFYTDNCNEILSFYRRSSITMVFSGLPFPEGTILDVNTAPGRCDAPSSIRLGIFYLTEAFPKLQFLGKVALQPYVHASKNHAKMTILFWIFGGSRFS